jgi:hypothetical protein
MVKYKLTIIWFILFFTAMTIAILTMTGSEEQDRYNPGVIMGAIVVLLCCPAFIFDYKQTDKYKHKQEEKKLKLQLQQKQLALAIKEKDLELTEKQLAHKEVITKFCPFCGKEIGEVASICPFCGMDLIIKEK